MCTILYELLMYMCVCWCIRLMFVYVMCTVSVCTITVVLMYTDLHVYLPCTTPCTTHMCTTPDTTRICTQVLPLPPQPHQYIWLYTDNVPVYTTVVCVLPLMLLLDNVAVTGVISSVVVCLLLVCAIWCYTLCVYAPLTPRRVT